MTKQQRSAEILTKMFGKPCVTSDNPTERRVLNIVSIGDENQNHFTYGSLMRL